MHADSLTVDNPRRWRFAAATAFAVAAIVALGFLWAAAPADASHQYCSFNDATFTTDCYPGYHASAASASGPAGPGA